MEKKRTIVQALICVGLLCVIWGGYLFFVKKVNQIIEVVKKDNFSWVVQVDEIENRDGDIVLSGFAFELNKDAEKKTYMIVLRNMDTGDYLYPKMRYVDRTDVNEYFLCEYDYTESGFVAIIDEDKLNLEENDYEVLLRPKYNKNPYSFETYVTKGKLMYTNPKGFKEIDVAGTGLEEVVRMGTLRVYQPDKFMYVYQYGEELYWFIDKKYSFIDDNVKIQYQLDTTQINSLPEIRLQNEWYWDNISFMLSWNELTDLPSELSYRVAKKAIPAGYSVSKIWTGYELDGELWLTYFRPRYIFE